MPRVFVSIGSNVERERNIRAAVAALRTRFGPLQLSRVYQTPAVGFAGEDFYNLVAAFDTAEPIERVREALIGIEAAQGRERNGPRYGPRTLDLDILLYGDLVRHGDGFDVPRGEITRHAFVLGPLAELAPDLRHPETGETMARLWENLDTARWQLMPVTLDLES
jgi:2-amino-4-hydroxy-6-hydroxymethyldihydropteridine diphosphokinase